MSKERFVLLLSVAAILLPFGVFATVLEPGTATPEEAFNRIVGGSAWSDIAFLIKGLAWTIALMFTVWATYGSYDAAFLSDSIKKKDFIILMIRLYVMLTIFTVLLSL
ncbi:hypothetical protein ACPV5U_24370 [Vibrio mediterranei]